MKMFRTLVLSVICTCTICLAHSQQLVKIWETDSTFKIPESTLYYPEQNIIFVSNIDGKSNEKDLNGSISKLDTDGKVIQHDWAVNLSAPKGMGIYAGKLYVADLTEIVVINLSDGKVQNRIPVNEAVFLNDITIDKNGVLFVSDSRTGKIHRVKNNNVTTYMENKMGVNGLLASGDDLFLAAKDSVWKADKNKKLTLLATGLDRSTDGIVQTADNGLIVSCWNGTIYSIPPTGEKKVLIDLRPEKINTADIGFNPTSNTLYVPTFLHNKVFAYRLEK